MSLEKFDNHGNMKCDVCGNTQSDSFKYCINCCDHTQLHLVETYFHGGSGWHLDVECSICGKNFGFDNEKIINDYMLVKK